MNSQPEILNLATPDNQGVKKPTRLLSEERLSLVIKDAEIMRTASEVLKLAFVGDSLPRKCGIATFTADLCESLAAEYPDTQCFVVPVNDIEGGYEYPARVRFEIEEQELSSYQRAAEFLNITNVGVVSLQHEFGIYGGLAGGHLLPLMRSLKMPVVTTLHTILRRPEADQRRVM